MTENGTLLETFQEAGGHPTFLKVSIILAEISVFYNIYNFLIQCVSEPPRGRVSAELSKPVERKGAK